ncbi:hypothetical protein D3C77_402160 [compost metagenome]|jgi:hypothetical protein
MSTLSEYRAPQQCVVFGAIPDGQTTTIGNLVSIYPEVLTFSGQPHLNPINAQITVHNGSLAIRTTLSADNGGVAGGPYEHWVHISAPNSRDKLRVKFDVTEGSVIIRGTEVVGVGTGYIVEAVPDDSVTFRRSTNLGKEVGTIVITEICVGG